MFLPNAYSFLLMRSVIKKEVIQSGIFGIQESATSLPSSASSDSGTKMLLPNKHSFLLARSVTSRPVIQSDIQESATSLSPLFFSPDSGSPRFGEAGKPTIVNKDKRTFLKAAGIAGASIIATLLLPKKADALIMGSSPTTGVVGVKNSTNARINPATEETVSSLATEATVSTILKQTDLEFDLSGNLNVNVASPITTATETTLETIAFGGKKYALKMTTVDSVDYIAEADTGTLEATNEWRVKKVDSTSGIIITWADGNENFDNVATNLPGLTYS